MAKTETMRGCALRKVVRNLAHKVGGVGFVPVSVVSVPLDYCDGTGECRSQRFGVLYSKFEFAVQDAIKNPKLKPRSRKRVLG